MASFLRFRPEVMAGTAAAFAKKIAPRFLVGDNEIYVVNIRLVAELRKIIFMDKAFQGFFFLDSIVTGHFPHPQ
jgi:hypothetical protein